MALLLFILQLAVWQPVRYPVLHQGHWQSCDHEERVLEHRVLGHLQWEMHLGPDDEFALYPGTVNGEHDHAAKANLLAPGYRYDGRAGKAWTAVVNGIHLWISVVQGGGSQDACIAHAYYIRVEEQR